MLAIDQNDIRRHNLEEIWQALIRLRRATRLTLASETGLSLMTVGNLVTLLDKQGILRLTPDMSPQGLDSGRQTGRRAQIIEINAENRVWLALDLTGLHFRLTMLRIDGAAVLPDWSRQYDARLSYEDNLSAFLTLAIQKTGLDSRRLIGVAVITPGQYDAQADMVMNSGIPEMSGVRLRNILQRVIPVERMIIDECVKFAAQAFPKRTWYGRDDIMQYLYIGETVGGATVYKGKAIRGLCGAAGGAGHVLTESGKMFEDELSLRALACKLTGVAHHGIGEDELESIVRLRAEEMGGMFESVFAGQARILAKLLYNIAWIINPTRVVIECRYANTLPFADVFKAETGAALARMLADKQTAVPEIIFADPSQPSALSGAVQALNAMWIGDIAGRPKAAPSKSTESSP